MDEWQRSDKEQPERAEKQYPFVVRNVAISGKWQNPPPPPKKKKIASRSRYTII